MKKVLIVTLVLVVLFTGISAYFVRADLGPPACVPGQGNQCRYTFIALVVNNPCPDGLDWGSEGCFKNNPAPPTNPVIEPPIVGTEPTEPIVEPTEVVETPVPTLVPTAQPTPTVEPTLVPTSGVPDQGNQVIPPDSAPIGCYTQITMNWLGATTKPSTYSNNHFSERGESALSCGMQVNYTYKGEIKTLTHLDEGVLCDQETGACIDNKAWVSYSGEVTWESEAVAPNGEGLTRMSIFNK